MARNDNSIFCSKKRPLFKILVFTFTLFHANQAIMKKTFILLPLFCFFNLSFAQSTLTVSDWRADLAFLKETVHKDYSFLFKKISAAEWDAQVEELH